MKGVNINHDGETYNFKATKNVLEAVKIKEHLDELDKISGVGDDESGVEYGNGWMVLKDCLNSKFVYAVWLNELSRIYAGNELMGIFTDIKDAKEYFIKQWNHQTERWGFKEISTKEIERDLKSYNDYLFYYRNNENDCQQTQGICKIEVGKGWLKIKTD